MVRTKIQHFKVVELPEVGVPSAFYYVLNENLTFTTYLTDAVGNYRVSSSPSSENDKWSDLEW